MRSSHRSFVVRSCLALLLAAAAGPGRAQHAGHGAAAGPEPARPYTERLRIGDDGAVTFPGPTAVGDWLLKPGSYRLEHAVEGGEHFIAFISSEALPAGAPAVRVRCRLEALKKPAKKTEVYALVSGGGARRVDWIRVQGESVAHLF